MIKKICILGYGSHVKKTIIPALNLNKNNLKIITTKSDSIGFEIFPDIRTALTKITKDYIIFNATPPNFHFITSKLLLKKGFNLIVEKPICMNVYQYKILKKLAIKKKLFLFENMMYFYSKQFLLFKKSLKTKKIKSFEMNFSIPNYSSQSFRKNFDSNLLLLYDVACYPLSLVSYLGYKMNHFDVHYRYKRKLLNKLTIFFKSNKIDFFIHVSFFCNYENYVKINYIDQSSIQFNHFFYGKKIKKTNTMRSANRYNIRNNTLRDYNVFKKILSFDKKSFYRLFKKNTSITEDYLKMISKIKKKLKNSSN